MTKILPVVLSGGSGTRLWPLSREKYPKQLLPLVGEQSMLQATVARLDGIAGLGEPLLVCNEDHRFVVAEQMRLLGKQGKALLEPFGRNTAPALTLAALWAQSQGDDPVLVVMPADHVILDGPVFRDTVVKAVALAEAGLAVTFGITPDCPETGYGYIRQGVPLADGSGAFRLARFVEKPNREVAQAYLDSGDYLWNSGLFVMRASTWMNALQLCRPDILDACRAALQGGQRRRRVCPGRPCHVRKMSIRFDRLCRDGAFDYRTGRFAGKCGHPVVGRLVGCWRLGCAMEGAAEERGGQCIARRRAARRLSRYAGDFRGPPGGLCRCQQSGGGRN